MPAAITADALLTRAKARAQMPAADGRLTDAEILAIADDLITTSIGRAVYDADGGRWLKTAADVSVTSGRSEYRIPTRAWAGGIAEALLVRSDGDVIPLAPVDYDAIHEHQRASWQDPRYCVMGDVIRLLPTPTDSAYSLRVRYIRRPSRLVLVAACGAVSTLTSSAITTASIPTSWNSATLVVDVVEATNNVEALEDDVTVTESGTNVLTRASGTNATTGAYAIEAGDYVCEAGQTCVVQVPDVAIGPLADLLAAKMCRVFGDNELASQLLGEGREALRDAEQAMANRTRTLQRAIPGSVLRHGAGARGRRPWWR